MALRSLCLAALIGLVSLSGVSGAWADGATAGKRAPEFDAAAKTVDGKKFRLKSLRGRWVAVTFGASWCKPCKEELPAWNKLAKQYGGRVTFVAVNIDNDRKKADKFVKKLGLGNMVVVFSPEENTTTADSYVGGADAKFPTTFVIDPNGVIRHVHREYHKGDERIFAAKLDELLGG